MADEVLASRLEQARQCARDGRWSSAIENYRAALKLAPRRAGTHLEIGRCFKELREPTAAANALAMALRLEPNLAEAHFELCGIWSRQGRLEDTVAAMRRAVALAPDNAFYHSCLVFLLHYEDDDAAIQAEQRRWAERHATPFKAHWRSHPNDRDPERPLRVGYVSHDFHFHAAAYVTYPLLAHHDPEQMQVVAYSSTPHPDEITDRFRQHVRLWRDIAGWSDERLAEVVREDRIDLLLDLQMHANGRRLLAFARRPAPVQIAWAFPGRTGIDAIDYRVSDATLDPIGAEARQGERTLRLPDCFWCYDPMAEPEMNALPAATAGEVTFGCVNNDLKITAPTVRMWGRVLRERPRARLLVLAAAGPGRERLLARLGREGVAAARVECLDRAPRDDYLRFHHRIDLALDPYPYGGHVTMCDGLWMGVPAVTREGATAVSRVGASQLRAVGLGEFVARDEDDYVRIAVQAADDRVRLAELRAGLRERMRRSPLMNGARFARNMETLYREAWRAWCASPREREG